jgi:hypothetical protein
MRGVSNLDERLTHVKIGILLTLFLATLTALIIPATAASRSDAAPSQIADTWSRTVTQADTRRRGPVATGLWRFDLKSSGAMSLFNSSSKKAIVTGRLTTGTSGTLKMLDMRITGGGRCRDEATYRWRLSGGRLVLSTGKDTCGGRAAVLVGSWRRT